MIFCSEIISYIFLTFILLVACFNIIGSLSMLILEKRKDVSTLRSLGASDRLIINIFVGEGILLGLFSALLAILLLYIGIYFLQEQMVDIFSIMELSTMIIVAAVVIVVGFVVSWISSWISVLGYLSKREDELY